MRALLPPLLRSLLAAALLLWAAAGCTPDFEDQWLVRDLRILALRATPPEVLFDAVPERFPPVRVEGLVVDPRAPGAPIQWELWLCPVEGNRCDLSSRAVRVARGTTPQDPIAADVVLTADLFQAAFAADTKRSYLGAPYPLRYRNGVPLFVELRVQRGESSDRAVKRLVYGERYPAQKAANQNPVLEEIQLRRLGRALPPPQLIDRPGDLTIWPRPSADSREEYLIAALDFADGIPTSLDEVNMPEEKTVRGTEWLTYFYYTDNGALSHGATGGPPNPFVQDFKVIDVSSRWTPDPSHNPALSPPEGPRVPADQATLWVIVTDGRGGLTWKSLGVRFR